MPCRKPTARSGRAWSMNTNRNTQRIRFPSPKVTPNHRYAIDVVVQGLGWKLTGLGWFAFLWGETVVHWGMWLLLDSLINLSTNMEHYTDSPWPYFFQIRGELAVTYGMGLLLLVRSNCLLTWNTKQFGGSPALFNSERNPLSTMVWNCYFQPNQTVY